MKALQKIFDILGKIIAIVWIINFVLMVTNAKFDYIHIDIMVKIINIIFNWGALLLVAVVGFEASSKKLWTLIPFLVILAFCVIMICFPDVAHKLGM